MKRLCKTYDGLISDERDRCDTSATFMRDVSQGHMMGIDKLKTFIRSKNGLLLSTVHEIKRRWTTILRRT